MVARVGVEPTTYRVWTDCSSQLSYLAKVNLMVGMTGFEPATPWSQIKYSTKLSYIPRKKRNFKFLARPAGLEPATFWSVVKRSIQLSYGRTFCLRCLVVGMEGVEPSQYCYQGILSPSRLPFRHIPTKWRFLPDSNRRSQSCSLLPYHLAKEPLHHCALLSY